MEKDDRVCERMSDSVYAEDIPSYGDQQSDAYIVVEAESECEEPKLKRITILTEYLKKKKQVFRV